VSAVEAHPKEDGRDAVAMSRLARRARRSAQWQRSTLYIGIGIVGALLLASAIGHFVLVSPTEQNLEETLMAPSLNHPFGTDDLGRDVLSRTLASTWVDLSVGVGTTYVSVFIGVLLGTLAGYLGRWTERIIMRTADVVIAFPFIVLVIAIVAILGPGVRGVLIGLVFAGWAFYARFARAEMLSLREKPYIQAGQTLGFSHRRVMFRHALPNLIRPSIVYSFSDIVLNILFLAALTYLGLGVQPPGSEWGAVIASGQQYLLSAWWISTLPGVVIVFVGVGFSFIGDGLADRLRTSRAAVR
jgi:peptide/nickel transport system permease protein